MASGTRSIAATRDIGVATTGDYSPVTVVMHQLAPMPNVLASLPAAPTMLSGRETEVARILSALRPVISRQPGPDPSSRSGPAAAALGQDAFPPVLVASIGGLAGVGKTALALTAGQAATKAGYFDGSLFIDLHGYDENPVQGGQALEAFLRALGVAHDAVPEAVEERAALYRTELAALAGQGRRLLIVADNASSAGQVRLLLPGNGMHRLLVTSRHTMATLNARLLDLGVLGSQAAVALLRHALLTADPTDRRVTEAGTALEELASLCGRLPLALHISAALLILEPCRTIAELNAELATAQSRLSFLDDGERAVRASFDLSYRRLPPDHAALFRLIALNPGPDIGLGAAAVLADLPLPAVRIVLRSLVQAHLLDCANQRWSMHDLVRDYASELAHSISNPPQHTAAEEAGQEAATEQARRHRRLLEHYATTTVAACARLGVQATPPAPGDFADRNEALAWLDYERANLTRSVAAAADAGHHDIAVNLPVALYDYLTWRGYYDDLISVTKTACRIAHQSGALAAEAGAWNNLGIALSEASRYEEAFRAYDRALELFTSLDNDNERGKVPNGRGLALRESGTPAEALRAHQEAVAIQRVTGDLREQAAALNNLSLAHQDLEDYAEACAAAESAASLFQRLGDTADEASALCTMAFALQAWGKPEDARAACRRALTASRAAGNPLIEAATLMTCAQLDNLTPQQQIEYLLQAETACEQANVAELRAAALSGIGVALTTAGKRDQAVTYFRRAQSLLEELGLTVQAAEVGEEIASLQS
ncbi:MULTISPECIES: tetratricopeptide repeat protein [unclassified Streptomyces]|uniref:tetratricopeptide repeat protein n=1 Tax=unclassified Streptomyces TaxID=2593676 RepID=UPI00131D7EDD|nr:tetratricopeptide repeat protein [Streptomyces sp. CB01635]